MTLRFLLKICGTLAMLASAAHSHDTRQLGDGKLSSGPKRGYLFACAPANPDAPGAQVQGPWINGTSVDMAKKIAVQGNVAWSGAQFSLRETAKGLAVKANNLPLHGTGVFPVSPDDPAYGFDRNPNEITAQRFAVTLPAYPAFAAAPACVPMGIVGFTLNNVVLFNAVDARGQDAAAHEVLDRCAGHPARGGVYHYHDLSPCLTDARDAQGHSELVGHAIDGFGLYGAFDQPGAAHVTNAELDECHGHTGPVTVDGQTQDAYHYHMNDEYPYSIGCLRGTPVKLR